MSSPLTRIDTEGRITSIREYDHDLSELAAAAAVADEPEGLSIAVGGSASGVINANGDTDTFTVSLVAGQTYLFSLRGTGAGALSDPLLTVLNPNGVTVATDDDGGIGTNSLVTITATTTGLYSIRAASFQNPDTDNVGGYTIDVRQQGVDAVGDTNATAGTLALGTTFGFRESGTGGSPVDPALAGDLDRYAVTLEAGKYYTFSIAGGYEPGAGASNNSALDTFLILRNAAGTIVATNDDVSATDFSSSIGFFAQTSGTYYLDATAYAGDTGGYVLQFDNVSLSTLNPLDAINWRTADNVPFVDVGGVPTAYVYFAAAGENFGERADDGVSPMVTYGWNDFEKQQVMVALEQYEKILGVNYEITTDVNQATFRLLTTVSDLYGARFYPQDEAYGTQQGIGTFNIANGGWSYDHQQGLEQGGFDFAVVLHEFGHAHGLAHPHDRGGGSDIMLGVVGATGSLGVFDLNQGVYTVMSYNDAWQKHPDGPSPLTGAGVDNGWSGTLSAFDIAALQQRYGVHAYATGDNVYQLADNVDDAFYQTIWDTGGTDTIAYGGSRNAQIDLTAATLDYSPTGGGVVSFVRNAPGTPSAQQIKGGFTIANGVVIENATGGLGNDTLIGNDVANVLTGNAGNDTLMGRAGDDTLIGGLGNDTLNGGDGSDTADFADGPQGVIVNLARGTASGAGNDTLIAIENVRASRGDDTITGDSFANRIKGETGNDHIDGGAGNDLLYGDGGDDTITGGAGDDYMDGGAGFDTIDFYGNSRGVVVDLGNNRAQDTGAGLDRFGNFEAVRGTVFSDRLTGSAGDERFKGEAGDDFIFGLGGNDTLYGDGGNDTLNGGTGYDVLGGGAGVDRFVFDSLDGDLVADWTTGEKIDVSAFAGASVNIVSRYGRATVSFDLDHDGQFDDGFFTVNIGSQAFSSGDLILA